MKHSVRFPFMLSLSKHSVSVLVSVFAINAALAQIPPSRPTSPPTARAAAQADFTGYWVAVVTEDWRWRMLTPSKGDFASVPVTAEAQKVAMAWDPAKDEAAGETCKGYGAPAIMRRPGRLHITWQDDNTLRIDADEGTQTRLLRFGGAAPQNAERSWQGYSVAQWEKPLRGSSVRSIRAAAPGKDTGALEVTTTQLRAGYLRKNGVPYSERATVKEYFDVVPGAEGEQWLIVTSIVEDPVYLREPFVTSSNFKKQRDSVGWNPTPCSAR